MKSFVSALATAVALFASPAFAAAPGPRDAADLKALAQAGDEAWNAADAERMAALYASDASLLVGGASDLLNGADAIERYFLAAFARRPAGLRHVTEIRAMDLVSPDLVNTDVEVRIEQRQADGSWKVVRRFDNVSVSVRDGDGWKLRVVRAYPRG